MIVCKNCGSQLDIKTKYCPYCGTPNKEAIEHIEEVENFKKDYEDTKKTVFSNVKTFSKAYKYLITLIILLISIFIVLIIGANSYEISHMYKENYYKQNKETIHLKIDSMIEKEEYAALGLYLNELEYYGRIEGLDKYHSISYILNDYNNIKRNILKYNDGNDNGYDNPLSRVSSYIFNFYDTYKYETNDVIEDIVLDMDDFLKAHALFSDEDLKMIKENPSESKISSLLQKMAGISYE